MKRILLVSDNHGDLKTIEKVLTFESHDEVWHLGDSQFDEHFMHRMFDHYVAGNHDFFEPSEDVFELEGIKFLLCHGHFHSIGMFTGKKSIKIAHRYGVDVLIHGHTHIPQDIVEGHTRVICPGSVSQGRSADGNTYAVMTIDKGQVLSVEFKQV